PTANRVVSFDTRLKLSPNWVAAGQVLRSYDTDLSGHTIAGNGFLADLVHDGRHFTYSGSYTDLDPNVRSRLGFVPRVDIRQVEQFTSYLWRPEKGGLVSIGPAATALFNVDHAGRTQDWVVSPAFDVSFTGQTLVKIAWSRSMERFEQIDFQKHS